MFEGMRKLIMHFVAVAIIMTVVMITAGAAMAQKHTCVYVNDNLYFGDGQNTVDGYNVAGTSATYLNPVLTGGTANGDDAYVESVTEVVLHPSKNILYVSDDVTHDVAAMKIDPDTCFLTLTGNYEVGGNDGDGIDLAISPNGKWLYVGNTTAPRLQLFDVRGDGSITVSKQVMNLPDRPAGMAVSPDGATLVVAFPRTFQVISYAIAPLTGMLTQVSDIVVGNETEGIAIDAESKFIYVGTLKDHAETIEQLEIGQGSTLTRLASKTVHEGLGSSSILLSSNGKYLYVSNGPSASITTFAVGSSAGTLKYKTLTPDGPAGNMPAGLATAANGTLLFSGAEGPGGNVLGIFSVGPGSSLVSLGTFYVSQTMPTAYPSSVAARTF